MPTTASASTPDLPRAPRPASPAATLASAALSIALGATTVAVVAQAVWAGVARGYELPPTPHESVLEVLACWVASALAYTFVRGGIGWMLATAIFSAMIVVGQLRAFDADVAPLFGAAPAGMLALCLAATYRAARRRRAGRWFLAAPALLVPYFVIVMGQSIVELQRDETLHPELAIFAMDASIGIFVIASVALLLVVEAAHILGVAWNARPNARGASVMDGVSLDPRRDRR